MAFVGFLRGNTAATLKLGPYLDSTDGNTDETALTISQADVRLSKNGGNYAQKNESTSATHDELGKYDCPIDATDTNTYGRLNVITHESGALTVDQDYIVLPEVVYDSLFPAAAGDPLPIFNILDWGTAQASAAGTLVHRSGLSLANDIPNGSTEIVYAGTGAGQSRVAHDFVGATDTASISPDWTTTPSTDSKYITISTPPAPTAVLPDVNAAQVGGDVVPSGAIPNAAAGASGGLLISGSNSGTTTLGALTITGATTHTGATVHTGNVSMAAGLNITQSSANTTALVVTGNGTGNGATFTSGSGATGQGVNISSVATNGSALVCTAAGTGTGFSASGGASGRGALFAAGATGTAGLAIAGGGTSGAGLTVTTTAGDAIQAIATAGHGMSLTANGTSKHGLIATGGTAGTSDGIKGVAGTGGIDIRGDITANAMVESYPADGAAPTIAQALMLTMQSVGEVSISGTTLTVNQLDGVTPAATYTLDSSTAPTSRTRAS